MVVTIIGGGLSGTLVAINLLRSHSKTNFRVKIIEKTGSIGTGLAYSTNEMSHLLNVRAGKMGIFHDNENHFYEWLVANGFTYTVNDFVPRKIFGNYVEDVFLTELKKNGSHVEIIQDEATDCKIIDANSVEIALKNSPSVKSNKVVIATGNFNPSHPFSPDKSFIDSPRYFQNAWSGNAFNHSNNKKTVVIIGTGLSMVDMIMSLHQMGHTGPIYAISKHGYIPVTHHTTHTAYPSYADEISSDAGLAEIFRVVRNHIKKAGESEISWQAVVDALRPHTQDIWFSLPLEEKKRFIRHMRHLWGVCRHRMAPENSLTIESLKAKKQFKICAGTITRLSDLENGIEVEYKMKGTDQLKTIVADIVLNCTGPESDIEKINSPLMRNLLSSGIIKVDAMKLGIDALRNGSIKDKDGNVNNLFFTLGTDMKGILWESTAVPDIRRQAYHLSNLIDSLKVEQFALTE